jgi:hypothetical protein
MLKVNSHNIPIQQLRIPFVCLYVSVNILLELTTEHMLPVLHGVKVLASARHANVRESWPNSAGKKLLMVVLDLV